MLTAPEAPPEARCHRTERAETPGDTHVRFVQQPWRPGTERDGEGGGVPAEGTQGATRQRREVLPAGPTARKRKRTVQAP